MEERGIEEQRIAFFERQLDVVRFKVIAEVLAALCEIPLGIALREGQELGRPAFHGHIGVSNGPLQREKGGHRVNVRRITFGLRDDLKTEVVVAVCLLCLSTGSYDIGLRSHLKMRTEPRLSDRAKYRAREVAGKHGGRAQAKLFLRAPDTVIGACPGEVVGALRRSNGGQGKTSRWFGPENRGSVFDGRWDCLRRWWW